MLNLDFDLYNDCFSKLKSNIYTKEDYSEYESEYDIYLGFVCCFVILSYRFGIIQFKFTGRKSYDEGKFYSICRD